ncbi:Ribulose-phosphate 3-epimerase [Planctomycetales bacterium 10988]|nr:Ribulose-phosphate 3-epimerase [Planctomycetales bacterium 10988]
MSRREHFLELRTQGPLIAPSILLSDFCNLEKETARLEAAGVSLLHLDVMDGHFVPNLTYGIPILEAFHRLTSLPLDVHMMVSNPADYVEEYAKAGASCFTFHIEAVPEPGPLLEKIRSCGMATGLALNPPTPLEKVIPYQSMVDNYLVMSVNPGFGGQSFETNALDKLQQLRSLVGFERLLEVDGGVNDETIKSCTDAGADLLVVGSAIFKHEDYTQRVQTLNRLVSH